MTATMTSDLIREQLLAPSMDATALNDQQAAMIVNGTPQIDSLVEHLIAALHGERTDEHLRAALGIVGRIQAANRAEGACERRISGAADDLARTFRDAELNGGQPAKMWSAKRVNRETRDALSVLLNPVLTGQHEDALAAVVAVVAACPRDVLLSERTLHELQPRKFRRLMDIAEMEVPTC